MSYSLVSEEKAIILGAVAVGASVIAAISYVLFGPEFLRGRNGVKCTGLTNLGNTCFVNSIIQALASLPSVSHWLNQCSGRCNGKLMSGLKELLHELNNGDHLEVSPRIVLDGLLWHGWVLDNQQQDALELYNVLLSTLEEELSGTQNSLSELKDMLEPGNCERRGILTKLGHTVSHFRLPHCPLRGLLVSSLKCCTCNKLLPTKYEHFESLSLHLKETFATKVSLEACLRNYMSCEIVTDVECGHCSKVSNRKQNFQKRILIGRPPKCLGIHILRTVWLSDGSISKNHTHLSFPMMLDIGQFTENRHSRLLYKLQAVVEHIGGSHSGHYCTYRCLGNHWVYTSDSVVYSVSSREVLDSQAYMLFYEKYQ